MKLQRQDTKVIETPFGKCEFRVEDESTYHFSFGDANENLVEDYQCTVDGHSFNGFLEIFSGLSNYDLDDNNPDLPEESLEKVLKWCHENKERLAPPELIKGAKIEDLLKEIADIKEDLNERLPKLLREKQYELGRLERPVRFQH